MDEPLRLSSAEINRAFAEPALAAQFPPVLTLSQASALLAVPLGTLRDWRSRGRMARCSRRVGRSVRVWRDRLIDDFFNGKLNG
jgi:hypothetical protein